MTKAAGGMSNTLSLYLRADVPGAAATFTGLHFANPGAANCTIFGAASNQTISQDAQLSVVLVVNTAVQVSSLAHE